MHTEIASKPWYQEAYVWMVIAIPATAVVVCSALLAAAISSNDGVVVDDYYKQGLQINLALARDHRAAALGLKAALSWQRDARTVTVTLTGQGPFTAPDTLMVKLVHPTRAGSDHVIELTRTPEGSHFGVVPPLARGLYLVQIESGDWRVTTKLDARD